MTEYANYIITSIGLIGFHFVGKKVWWAWYINIFNQVLWFSYGVVTEQWGFVVGTFFYTFVFVKNAISWTKEHRAKVKWDKWKDDLSGQVLGAAAYIDFTGEGMSAEFTLNEAGKKWMDEQEARYEKMFLPGVDKPVTVVNNYGPLDAEEIYRQTKNQLEKGNPWDEQGNQDRP